MTPTIQVFTFKDGLLARLAHDLQLSLTRFDLRREADAITGTFWPGSLVVDGPVGKRGVDTTAFSAANRAEIAGNMAEVLQAAKHPEARLVGRMSGRSVQGELTLVGRTLPIEGTVTEAGGLLIAEVTLVPSRWGIAPYRALAGAIKLQDRVVVRATGPDAASPGGWRSGM
jgi:hypothetical protein